MKLHHAALICSSLKNADEFYEGILGLKKIKTSRLTWDFAEELFGVSGECQIILYTNENFAVEVFLRPQPSNNPFAHLCLELKDKKGFVKKCLAKGLEVNQVRRGESLIIFVKDYDGNRFEIKEEQA